MRNSLATIQKISAIETHPNADTLEIAHVLGWKVIIKKGEFNVGDLVVYCEVDSILPPRPEFAFLESKNYRIRAIKLRGLVSMGIVFPIDILGKSTMENYREGDDVTDILEITQYSPPEPAVLGGTVKGKFPEFLRKTNEDRIQKLPGLFEEYKKSLIPWYITEKIDGTSATYYFYEGNVGVCSHNLELVFNKDVAFCKVALSLNLEDKMRMYGKPLAIQGELYGEKIQGNKYKQKGIHFKVFSIYDINAQKYVDYKGLIEISNIFSLEIVPIVPNPPERFDSIDRLENFVSNLKSNLNKDVPVEGIVMRPTVEGYSYDTETNRISFKCINPNFLLKYDV